MLPEETDISPAVEAGTLVPPPIQDSREPFWGYFDLALVLGLLLASIVLITLGAAAAVVIRPGLKNDPTPLLLPSNVAIYLLLYLVFRIVFAARYGQPVFASLGWRHTKPAMLGIAALIGAPLAFAVDGVAYLLHTPKINTPIDELTRSPLMLVLFGIMAVTIAPIFEELFFRGFLQPLFARTFGVVAGIVITAVLFGALHAFQYQFVWQYVVAVSLVGIALGTIRARTNSIIPSTIMHGCYNAMFIVALAVTKHT